MKNINKYINEKLHVTTKSHIQRYTCQPKNKDELRKIIIQRIQDEGNDCDLNDIDVSKITDMGNLLNVMEDQYLKISMVIYPTGMFQMLQIWLVCLMDVKNLDVTCQAGMCQMQ